MDQTVRTNLRYAIGASLFGLIFLWFAVHFYNQADVGPKETIQLNGTLSENLKTERHRRSQSLVIKLAEYPGLQFHIGGVSLKGTASSDLKADLHIGNPIRLTISQTDYGKKITRKIPLSFWESYWNFERIHVLEASTDEFDYLTLADYNRVHRQNARWGMGVFGFFSVLFLAAAALFYAKRHEASFEQKPNKRKRKS
ncbi:hypothetical protein [Flavobacterium sp.]|uniref:hypothetical protein n=1 Tax=Flavobacterium sp. TaxID=239 RepID=UPI0039E6E50F